MNTRIPRGSLARGIHLPEDEIMNEIESSIVTAILKGNSTEALELIVEAVQPGNKIVRFYADKYTSYLPFPIHKLNYGTKIELGICINFFMEAMQKGMFHIDRVEIVDSPNQPGR